MLSLLKRTFPRGTRMVSGGARLFYSVRGYILGAIALMCIYEYSQRYHRVKQPVVAPPAKLPMKEIPMGIDCSCPDTTTNTDHMRHKIPRKNETTGGGINISDIADIIDFHGKCERKDTKDKDKKGTKDAPKSRRKGKGGEARGKKIAKAVKSTKKIKRR